MLKKINLFTHETMAEFALQNDFVEFNLTVTSEIQIDINIYTIHHLILTVLNVLLFIVEHWWKRGQVLSRRISKST